MKGVKVNVINCTNVQDNIIQKLVNKAITEDFVPTHVIATQENEERILIRVEDHNKGVGYRFTAKRVMAW